MTAVPPRAPSAVTGVHVFDQSEYKAVSCLGDARHTVARDVGPKLLFVGARRD